MDVHVDVDVPSIQYIRICRYVPPLIAIAGSLTDWPRRLAAQLGMLMLGSMGSLGSLGEEELGEVRIRWSRQGARLVRAGRGGRGERESEGLICVTPLNPGAIPV